MPKLKAGFSLLKETYNAWQRDKASRLAAALAYYTIFSITPLLIIILAITGLVYGERAARDEIAYLLDDLVGLETAAFIQTMLANFENPASGIVTSLVGLVTLLYGATGLLYQVQDALNTIWKVQTSTGNGFVYQVKQRFIHLAIVFGVGAFLLLALSAEIAITTITEYLNLDGILESRTLIFYPLMVTLVFAVLYKILPDAKTGWRDVLIGAVMTSFLFNIGRYFIGIYMRWTAVGSAYGAAGSLVGLLVWVYYSAQIFLLGAEFTHVYAHAYGSLREPVNVSANNREPVTAVPSEDAVDKRQQSLPGYASGYSDVVETGSSTATVLRNADDAKVAPDAMAVVDESKKHVGSKKAVTILTVLGTIAASILGANWLHQKRKKNQGQQGG